MQLNLKDDETIALVTEVAQRLGLSKTGAVRELARQKLAQLDEFDAADQDERTRHALAWLERDVWPASTGLRRLSKSAEEALLGYDELAP